MDQAPFTPQAILAHPDPGGCGSIAVTPEAERAARAALDQLVGSHGPAHEPFFRDLLGLAPADGTAEPMPAWAEQCRDRCAGLLLAEAAGRNHPDSRTLGRALGLALGAEAVARNPGPVTAGAAETLTALGGKLQAAVSQLLAVSVRFPAADRAEFHQGFAEVQDHPLWEQPAGHLGAFGEFYPLVVWGWREIARLPTRTAFHAWLTERLGAGVVGDAKRVERFCAEIGLKFTGRGRPRKPGSPAQSGPEKHP